MGGAIIQLVAFGSQNIYVTGQPQITFFKSVYRRYTNFSMESIQQDIKGNVVPGNYVSSTISRNGDLLNTLYVQYNPQSIYNVPILFQNGGIPSNLGNCLLKEMEIEIGGQIIDRQYSVWLTIWNDVSTIKYISPAPPVDTFQGSTGVEPSVSPLYNRMTYNHNQQNTQVNLNLRIGPGGNSPLNTESSFILKFYTYDVNVFPDAGGFDIRVTNYNNFELFDSFSTYHLYFTVGLNYYIILVGGIDYSVIDQITFTNCVPVAPTVYPGGYFDIPEGTEVFQAFTFFQDNPVNQGNIIYPDGSMSAAGNPYSGSITVEPDVNNAGIYNNYFTTSQFIIVLTADGSVLNMTHDSYVGENFTPFVEPVISLPPDNLCLNPTGSVINLNTPGLAYCIFTDVQAYNNPGLNIIPTSGLFDFSVSCTQDLYSPVQQLPTSGLFIFTIGTVEYYIRYPDFKRPYFDPTTGLFLYLFNDCVPLTYPSVPVVIPENDPVTGNEVVVYFSYYESTLYNAPTEAYVPLQFWFCKNPGLSLPLIALQYHEVKINLLLPTFQELHATRLVDVNLSSMKLYAEYVFLDTAERRLFSQNAHEYLIEQVQSQVFNNNFNSNLSGGDLQIDLNFSNPVKELVFCGSPNVYGIYSQGLATPTPMLTTVAELSNVTLQLTINQISRFSPRNLKYFTRNQLWDCHSGSGSCNSVPGEVGIDNIGVYSFALRPEDHQPSGTCNFSRIVNPRFVFSNFNNLEQLSPLNIYATTYNILRIMAGMGSLVYVN